MRFYHLKRQLDLEKHVVEAKAERRGVREGKQVVAETHWSCDHQKHASEVEADVHELFRYKLLHSLSGYEMNERRGEKSKKGIREK